MHARAGRGRVGLVVEDAVLGDLAHLGHVRLERLLAAVLVRRRDVLLPVRLRRLLLGARARAAEVVRAARRRHHDLHLLRRRLVALGGRLGEERRDVVLGRRGRLDVRVRLLAQVGRLRRAEDHVVARRAVDVAARGVRARLGLAVRGRVLVENELCVRGCARVARRRRSGKGADA